MDPSSRDVTLLLERVRKGEAGAADALLALVYDELRATARRAFGRGREMTLQPTSLVHEAWLKLAGNLNGLDNRGHFLAVASKAMRQVLTDHARGRLREKRGSGDRGVTLVSTDGLDSDPGFELIALNDSLAKLEQLNPRHARVVELRFLGGLTIEEAARELQVSPSTVEEDWAMARAWLRTELSCD